MSGKGRDPLRARNVLVPLGAGLVMSAAVLIIGGIPPAGTEESWRRICDALTVPGILLTGMGLLSVVSDLGAFDGISFTVRKAFGQIRSAEKRAAMPKTYYDYLSVRQKKKRTRRHTTLYIGLGFLVCAAAALLIYLSRFPS